MGKKNGYNPLQPRRPDGRFASWDIPYGTKVEYTRSWWRNGQKISKVCEMYMNDPKLLNPGNSIMKVAAQGKVFSKLGDDPLERVHMMSDENGDMMSVAASERGTFGVIDHNQDGFEYPHSLSRGNRFQPQPQNLAPGEQTYGGRAALMTGRPDGKTYDVLNARKAERTNMNAFCADGAAVFAEDPKVFAEKVIEVRDSYRKMSIPVYDDEGKPVLDPMTGKQRVTHLTESQARRMPVHVFVDGRTGKLMLKPAMKLDPKTGTLVALQSPNTHKGSHSVKLTCADITRMTRSMQEEGIKSVSFTITHGTQTTRNGKPNGNALHFRAEYSNQYSHHEVTMWGSIENKNRGVDREAARSAIMNEDGTVNVEKRREYQIRVHERRQREADPYRHPATERDATMFYRKATGSNRTVPGRCELLPGDRFTFRQGRGYDTVFSGDNARAVGIQISSKQGAAIHAMMLRKGGIMPDDSSISYNKSKDLYTVHWYDGKVDRFTSDGSPVVRDDQ